MSMDRMEHAGFTSGEAKGRMGPPRYVAGAVSSAARRRAGRIRRAAPTPPRAGGMLVKAGLCAAVCAGVLLLRWAQAPAQAVPTGSVRQAVNGAGAAEGEGVYDNTLGRLQFVELPSIIEVFSRSAGPELGVDYEAASLDGDTLLATLTLDHAQDITAPAACKVKETGEDPALGQYVRLAMQEADNEVVYYGLSGVVVEEGQLLCAQDTLAQAEAKLSLAVYSAGRPEDPLAYFGLKTGQV